MTTITIFPELSTGDSHPVQKRRVFAFGLVRLRLSQQRHKLAENPENMRVLGLMVVEEEPISDKDNELID